MYCCHTTLQGESLFSCLVIPFHFSVVSFFCSCSHLVWVLSFFRMGSFLLTKPSSQSHMRKSQSWPYPVNCNVISLLAYLIPNHLEKDSCITFMCGILVEGISPYDSRESLWLNPTGHEWMVALYQTLFWSLVCSLNNELTFCLPIVYFAFNIAVRIWSCTFF